MGAGGSRSEAQGEARAGALILSLLASPPSPQILEELSRGPRRLAELRRQLGSPQGIVRTRLGQLAELGVVERRWRSPLGSGREYELTASAGRELLFVTRTLRDWLASAPTEPLDFDHEAGQAAVDALAHSWSSRLMRALARGPASPAELDGESGLTEDGMRRRLQALRRAGLVKSHSGGAQTRYELTDWLRKGTGPFGAAARWERRHAPQLGAPLQPVDAEAAFLLAIPLLKPAPNLAGSCRLAVEFDDGKGGCPAGVYVELAAGSVVSCTTRLDGSPDAWATGSPSAWLRTAIESNPGRLELGGNHRLVRGLVEGLNQELFGPPRPLPPS